VDAMNPDAVNRIYEIKKRSHHKPISILIHGQEDILQLTHNVSATALQIMNHFWPGEVTVVLDAADSLPQNLTAGSGKIGVRRPQHPVAVALVKAVQGPITATSANLTGKKGCVRIDDLDPRIAEQLDIILDAGPLKGGIGSTVVDVTIDPPVILREGAVAAKDIFAIL
jgi:L-threonylcarbamoyladenylate synthase